MMTACNKSTVLLKPTIPSNLLQPCPDLQTLNSGTGKSVMLWSTDTIAKYNDCKLRHAKLVEAVK